MGVQVDADGAEGAGAMVDGGDDGALAAEPLLAAAKLVLAVGKGNGVEVAERVAREDGIAVKRLAVVRSDLRFDAAAFAEVQVAGGEGIVEPQRPGEVEGDVAVSRAGHADVELGEEEDVGIPGAGVAPEHIPNAVEAAATLDVPRERPDGSGRRGRGRAEGAVNDGGEERLHFVPEAAVAVGALKGPGRAKGPETLEVGRQVVIEGPAPRRPDFVAVESEGHGPPEGSSLRIPPESCAMK